MEVGLSVLIVHNDPVERQLVESVLRNFRVKVEALGSGSDAVNQVKKEKYDGVFIDAELPDVSGLELVRKIRKSSSNSKIPIVFITNQASSIPLSDAFEAGVTFFLTRPLDVKKVQRLLNATRGAMLVERRRYHRVPVQAPVVFKAGAKTGKGHSVNISRSGILLEARGGLKMGDVVEMEISLPGPAGMVRAVGEVVRVDDAGHAGIHFTKLSAADLEQLQNFIGV